MTRWGPRYTREDLTLANAFTAARLVLIPVFGWLWYHDDSERALLVFVVAAATDLVDGFLARFLNQASRLGALLDPIADKLLIFVALVVGLARGDVPVWFAAVLIARDALLGVAAILLSTRWRGRHGPEAWRPTKIGKYAMFMQSITIALLIIDSAVGPAGMRGYVEVAMIWTAVLAVVAWGQYALRAARAIGQKQETA